MNDLERIKQIAGLNEGIFDNKVSPLEQACRLGLKTIHNLSAMLEVLRDDIIELEDSPNEVVNHINNILENAAEDAAIIRKIRQTGKY